MYKLKENDRLRVVQMYNDGLSSYKIAEAYGVTHQAIDYTLNKRGVVKRRDVSIIGQTFGGFKVIGMGAKNFKCQCLKCGNVKHWHKYQLKNPKSLYCTACLKAEKLAKIVPIITEWYNSGMSAKTICEKLYEAGLARSSTNQMYPLLLLHKNNVKVRPKGFQKGRRK